MFKLSLCSISYCEPGRRSFSIIFNTLVYVYFWLCMLLMFVESNSFFLFNAKINLGCIYKLLMFKLSFCCISGYNTSVCFVLCDVSLEKEASSVLRSCGWSGNVYSFMCSRKRVREAGNTPSGSDLK